MSKSPLPPDLDPPPSYTASPPLYTSLPLQSPSSSPSSSFQQGATPLSTVLDPLSSHLRALPSRVRQANLAQHSARAAADLEALERALPEVEGFLASAPDVLGKAAAARLVLVPGAAVPEAWMLSEGEEWKRRREVVTVGRVDGRREGNVKGGDEKGRGGKVEREREREREFDDWGRWDDGDGEASAEGEEALWWRDEDMARRLAGYLQPKEQVKTERREVRAEVQQQQREKRGLFGGWGRKAPEARPVTAERVIPAGRPDTEGVSMTVRAEEVTFRRENEFGIWESRSGWGVVVTVRIRKM